MKRFFFISASIHAALIAFLISWEVPLAGRVSSMKVLEVSIVEMQEAKPEEKRTEGPRPAAPRKLVTAESVKKAQVKTQPDIPAPAAFPNPEIKKEETRAADLDPPEKEEIKKPEPEPGNKGRLEERGVTASVEINPGMMGEANPSRAGEPGRESTPGSEAHRNSTGKGNSGATFLAPVGPELNERNQGGSDTGAGTSPGGGTRLASLGPLQQGDPVVSEILRRIEKAKLYPRAARKMSIEGKAAVRFKLKPDGKVASVELVESSGSEILDKASLETVQRAAPLPYKEGWLKVMIVFKIL